MIKDLIELANAYESADENDYCNYGKYEGLRPDEITNQIIRVIRKLENKL